MKISITKLLSLGMLSILLTSCNGGNAKPYLKDKVDLFYAYSHENLRSDYDYYNSDEKYKNRGTTLKFNLIKGETDGAQLIMHARENISSYNLEMVQPLTNEKGNTIDNSHVTFFAEWYQYVKTSVESITIFKRGYYPDALIPLDAYISHKKDFVAANKNQAIYVNLETPADAATGNYKGLAKLTVDGMSYDIPLEATVHNVTMPEEVHFQGSFLIWYDQIPLGEKENTTNEVMDNYFNTVVSKRISPDQLPPYATTDVDYWADQIYERVASNPKITRSRFPVAYTNYSEANIRKYMEALADKQEELLLEGNTTDMFKKMYFYIVDEPSSGDFDHLRDVDSTIYKVKKEYAQRFSSYPELYNSIIHINNCVTSPFIDAIVATESKGGVQTWCPQFDNFHSQANRDIYKSRQESNLREGGEQVWWYGCLSPKGYYPSFHLDATSVYQKVLPIMQFTYNIQTMIYWNVCYYSKYEASGTQSSRDIWYDPITWAGCAGDGYLLYPGYDYDLKNPISTLRFENILQGNESYEYMYMLDEFVKKYNETHAPALPYDTNELMKAQCAKIFDGVQPKHDSDLIVTFTENLLTALDKFNNSLDEGMDYLLSLGK